MAIGGRSTVATEYCSGCNYDMAAVIMIYESKTANAPTKLFVASQISESSGDDVQITGVRALRTSSKGFGSTKAAFNGVFETRDNSMLYFGGTSDTNTLNVFKFDVGDGCMEE